MYKHLKFLRILINLITGFQNIDILSCHQYLISLPGKYARHHILPHNKLLLPISPLLVNRFLLCLDHKLSVLVFYNPLIQPLGQHLDVDLDDGGEQGVVDLDDLGVCALVEEFSQYCDDLASPTFLALIYEVAQSLHYL